MNILNITTSDWIQIVIAGITLFSVLTSIVIANKTLKQNSKMIEETTRPNIIFYKDTLNINSPIEYIVIKNIGGSLAHINSISCSKSITDTIKFHEQDLYKSLKNLCNGYLAPQQSYKIPIVTKESEHKTLEINITYSTNVKTYSETYVISLKQDQSITHVQQHQPSNETKVISNAIQELIKRTS